MKGECGLSKTEMKTQKGRSSILWRGLKYFAVQ